MLRVLVVRVYPAYSYQRFSSLQFSFDFLRTFMRHNAPRLLLQPWPLRREFRWRNLEFLAFQRLLDLRNVFLPRQRDYPAAGPARSCAFCPYAPGLDAVLYRVHHAFWNHAAARKQTVVEDE